MTALVEGTWLTLGTFAGVAAVMCLTGLAVYLWLTWRQDREEQTRPERRGLVSVEESNTEGRRAGSVAALVFMALAVVVVIVLAALGV